MRVPPVAYNESSVSYSPRPPSIRRAAVSLHLGPEDVERGPIIEAPAVEKPNANRQQGHDDERPEQGPRRHHKGPLKDEVGEAPRRRKGEEEPGNRRKGAEEQ